MIDPSQTAANHKPAADLERFEIAIVVIAFVLYGIERCLAFAFLQCRMDTAGGLESQFLEFFFGKQPYSILDILLGFDFGDGLLSLFQPRNLLLVTFQIIHFWINYWILKLPLLLLSRVLKRNTE